MKSAKMWCLASLMMVAGLSSASCGKDEGTEGGGGHGMVIGGTGGTAGSGGMTGRSGSSTGGGASAATKLGRACVADNDCIDPAAPGLTCLTGKDTVLGDGAPPKGLCTMACSRPQTADDVDVCEALGSEGFCFSFTGGTEGYCIEGCHFGPSDIGEAPKCHNRPEFACDPALLGPTDTACDATADCPSGDLCVDGACNLVLPGCLPACRGDLDCEPGLYCDQSFLGGTCLTAKPTGKALGEPCTVPPANAPAEPDECVGFCQTDPGSTTKGHCAATCGLFSQCGWNTATQKYDGLCAYGTILTMDAATADAGDFGFCTLACNCTSECTEPGLACTIDQVELNDTFKGSGLCFTADPATPEYNQCTGAGGAGGESGIGASGASGAPAGASGSPNGGDGSGGVGGAG